VTKRQLYIDIALRHTPEGIKICTVSEEMKAAGHLGLAHRFAEWEDEEDDFVPGMEVPRGRSL
jgi:hypothetical protein